MASKSSKGGPEYEWIKVTEKAAFAPRDGAGALVFDGRMWLLGGWNRVDKTNFPCVCNNEVWRSQDGADWTLEKPGVFVHANALWMVAGNNMDSDVWKLVRTRHDEDSTRQGPPSASVSTLR